MARRMERETRRASPDPPNVAAISAHPVPSARRSANWRSSSLSTGGGEVREATRSPNSAKNRSRPAGAAVHKSRAGTSPTLRNACGALAGTLTVSLIVQIAIVAKMLDTTFGAAILVVLAMCFVSVLVVLAIFAIVFVLVLLLAGVGFALRH